jgi:branched-chain amino acid transport system substrate-binding protein
MKTKCFILFTGLIFLFTPFYSSAETIRLGLFTPVTGDWAYSGKQQFQGAMIASDMINDKGGIAGKKVEWVRGDVTDPKVAMNEAERLITQEKVKVLVSGWSSSCAYAGSQVAEKYKAIFWETNNSADEITQRGFRYLFRVCPFASALGYKMTDYAVKEAAPKLGISAKDLRISIIHEDTMFGTTLADAAKRKATEYNKEYGVQLVSFNSYDHRVTDLSPLVMSIKAAKPDILLACCYINDGLLFYRTMKAMDANVKSFIGGGALFSLPVFVETFRDEVNYVFSVDLATTLVNKASLSPKGRATLEEFHRRYEAKYGELPSPHASDFFVGTWALLSDVLSKAGSADPEKIRHVAENLDIPYGDTIFGWGVKFDSTHQNTRSFVFNQQWQNKKLVVVDPSKYALGEAVFPFPTWAERGKR